MTLRPLALCLLSPLFVACVVETSHGRDRDPQPTSSVTGNPASGGDTTSAPGDAGTTGDALAAPRLFDVDTGAALDVQPGQGAGVFIEYDAGGHWKLSWSCDTAINAGHACAFDVQVKALSGTITNIDSSGLGAGAVVKGNTSPLEVQTTTRTGLDVLKLDTDAGAVLSLDVTLDGQRTTQIFFFVQGGAVNGGYPASMLTNPLLLEGNTP